MSFSIGEEALRRLDVSAVAGDYAAWSYFQSVESSENTKFLQTLKRIVTAWAMAESWAERQLTATTPRKVGLGLLGGAHPYEASRGEPIQRNGEPIQDERHLTDVFTDDPRIRGLFTTR